MSYLDSYIQNDKFSRFVSVSIAFHVGVFLFFTVKTAFFPSEDIVIKNAIRVDVVDLPDKVEKPRAEPVAQKPPIKPKVKKPTKPKKADLKKIKNKQQDALARLKAQEALKKIQDDLKKAEKPVPKKPTEYKGNIKTSGDSLKGLDKFKFNEYYSQIKSHVRNHWNLPQWLANANLKVQVVVYIDQRGNVTRKELIKSSNNAIFDETALGAVDSSSPFPEPPERLKSKLDVISFVFNFPQE